MPQKKLDQVIIENGPSIPPAYWLRPLLILLALILFAGAVFGLGISFGRQGSVPKTPPLSVSPCSTLATQPKVNDKDTIYQEGYQAALKFARQKVANLIPGMRSETHSLSGALKSLQDKSVVITMDASQIDFFAEGKVDKIFVVSPTISIEQWKEKPAEQLNIELKKYNADLNAFRITQAQKDFDPSKSLPPTPPNFVVVNKIALKDLKIGDFIELITKSDLESKDPLDATSIRLLSQPAVSANPPSPGLLPADSISPTSLNSTDAVPQAPIVTTPPSPADAAPQISVPADHPTGQAGVPKP